MLFTATTIKRKPVETRLLLAYLGCTVRLGKTAEKIILGIILLGILLGALELLEIARVDVFPFSLISSIGQAIILLFLFGIITYGVTAVITPFGWCWIYFFFRKILLGVSNPNEYALRKTIMVSASALALIVFSMGFGGNGQDIWKHIPEIVLITNVVAGFAYIVNESLQRTATRAYLRAKKAEICVEDESIAIRFQERVFAEPGLMIGRMIQKGDDSIELEIKFVRKPEWSKTEEIRLPIRYFLSRTHEYFEAPAVLVDEAILLIPFVKNVNYTLFGGRDLHVAQGDDYATAKVERKHISLWYRFKETRGVKLSIVHRSSKIRETVYRASAIPFIQYRPEFDEIYENKVLILPISKKYEIAEAVFPDSVSQIERAVADRVRNGILAMGNDFELELEIYVPLNPNVRDRTNLVISPGIGEEHEDRHM